MERFVGDSSGLVRAAPPNVIIARVLACGNPLEIVSVVFI